MASVHDILSGLVTPKDHRPVISPQALADAEAFTSADSESDDAVQRLEPALMLPALTALDPDLVTAQLKRERSKRRRRE